MKTAEGNTYNVLLNIQATDKQLTLTYNNFLPAALIEATPESIAAMIPLISEKIAQGTKPAGTLIKQLERIEQHREHLLDAYTELWRCYKAMTEPQTRTSPIDKARSEMLSGIPDMKILRMMCTISLGEKADDFILPDDKAALIAATVAAMREPPVPSRATEPA